MDAEIEGEGMVMTYMELEGNFDIPGVDMEGKEPPQKSLRSMTLTSHKIQV